MDGMAGRATASGAELARSSASAARPANRVLRVPAVRCRRSLERGPRRREAAWRDLMGDLPFAPSQNSADVWANPETLRLLEIRRRAARRLQRHRPALGAADVPLGPMRRSGWRWMRARARRMAELYDLFRVDHVVGLFRTFYFDGEIPGGFDPPTESAQIAQGREILRLLAEEVAAGCHRCRGPRSDSAVRSRDARRARRPRLQSAALAARRSGVHRSRHLPRVLDRDHGHSRQRMPGRVVGLARCAGANGFGRLACLGCRGAEAYPALRRSSIELYRSPSRYAILPIQDLFGWRERINIPATVGSGNWIYRLPAPLERLRADPAVRTDAAALQALIDGSGRLRKIGVTASRRAKHGQARTRGARGRDGRVQDRERASQRAAIPLSRGGPGSAGALPARLSRPREIVSLSAPGARHGGVPRGCSVSCGYAPTDVPPHGPYQAAALAQDAAALVEALSPSEPAFVFGHDWGALAAYGAAQLAPRRIRKIATAAVPHGPQLLQAIVSNYSIRCVAPGTSSCSSCRRPKPPCPAPASRFSTGCGQTGRRAGRCRAGRWRRSRKPFGGPACCRLRSAITALRSIRRSRSPSSPSYNPR